MEQVLEPERQHCLMNSIIHSADLAYRVLAEESCMPHVLLRPKVSIDGNQWCALYGDNLQDGIAGFGDSPHKAMQAFDAEYFKALPQPSEPESRRG